MAYNADFYRKALGLPNAQIPPPRRMAPDADPSGRQNYWDTGQAAAPTPEIGPPIHSSLPDPGSPWIDNGRGSGGTFDPSNGPPPQYGGPLGTYSNDAAGLYQRLLDELTDKRGQDWASADFGQKYGTSWLTGNKERMINEALPALAGFARGSQGPRTYDDIIADYDTRYTKSPWHQLQLLYSASTLMDQDSANDRLLYDRTGDVGGEEDTAYRHFLAGFHGGGPASVQWKDRSNPRYWIR